MKKYLSSILIILSFNLFAQSKVEQHLVNKHIKGLVKEPNNLYFLVIGDWGRNGQTNQQAVADWMGVAANQVEASFVVSTGDNFYCCGVASIDDPHWQSSFENVYRSHSLQIPWYPVLGNHDYQGNVNAQIDYSKKSRRWQMPSRYYTKASDDVRLIFLDTNPFIKSYHSDYLNETDLTKQDTTRQLQWLDSLLTHKKEKMVMVFGHQPVFSTGHYGNTEDLVKVLKPRFEKHNVQMYFCGHEHDLQHQMINGVNYFVSGGGSNFRKNKDNQSYTKMATVTSGFMVVSVGKTSVTIYTIDYKGKIIYQTTVEK